MSIKERIKNMIVEIGKENTVAAIQSATDIMEDNISDLRKDIEDIEKHLTSVDRWMTITTKYNTELKEQIEGFVREQAVNSAMLQAEFNAIMNTPWYKMITKKQRGEVLGSAIIKANREAVEKLDKIKKV